MTDKHKSVYASLHRIQTLLKAPKQANKNVAFKSRSAEQILDAVKEFLEDGEVILLNDEIVSIGNRFYVKSIASLCLDKECVSSTAFAREPEESKVMQPPQLTGSSSSYARKYALGGLFAIDDSKDDPDQNAHPDEKVKPPKEAKPEIVPFSGEEFVALQKEIKACKSNEELAEVRAKATAAKPRMSKEQMTVIAKEIGGKGAELVIDEQRDTIIGAG